MVNLKLRDQGFLRGGLLLIEDLLDIVGHLLSQLRISQRRQRPEAFHISVLLTGDVSEESPALGYLLDGLIERDGHPLVLTARTGAFEDLANPVGVIGGLQPRLALGTEGAVDGCGVVNGSSEGQMRNQSERVVWIAIDLSDDSVLNLAPYPAPGVALKAGRENMVIGLVERVQGVGSRAVQDSAARLGIGSRLCGADGKLGNKPSAEQGASGK